MARDARAKRDWTYRLENVKIYVYILEVVVFVLYIVRGVLNDIEEVREGYFNLPKVLVPISIMIALIGIEEVAISALCGAFRKDHGERYRFLEGAKRSAITTLIVAVIIVVIMVAPPIQDMLEDASGRNVEETRVDLYRTFSSKDSLNLTGLQRAHVTTTDGTRFNVSLLRGDSLSTGVEESSAYNVTEWEHTFDIDDVDDFVLAADPVEATQIPTWKLSLEPKLRPELVQGIVVPFFLLAVANAVFYPVARLWSSKTETRYVDTQTKKLRARFKVEEAFLIYEDGRLIAHNSRRLKPERDKDIMTGMLTAVQSFVTDTLIDEERGTLDQLKYGTLSILVEGKMNVNLACIISGEESPVLRQGMKNIVSYISGQYQRYLRDWDGDVDRFKDVKRYIGHLVSTGKEEPVYPDELFLLHRDGRLVAHQTSRLEPSIDDSMLQSWVDQIVGAINKSMADPSKPMPTVVNIMGYDVFLEFTNYLHMAYMTTRKESDELRELIVDTLQDIDARFHNILYDWDGATQELTDVKTMMEVVLGPTG